MRITPPSPAVTANVVPQPHRRPSGRSGLIVAGFAALALAATPAAHAAVYSVTQSSGAITSTWVANTSSPSNRAFSFASLGNGHPLFGSVYGQTTDLVDDSPGQGARPFGRLTVPNAGFFGLSSSFYRAGDTPVMTGLTYDSVTFLSSNVLQNNAQNGTDNYVAFKTLGSDSSYYYGWLQFELNQFSNGQTAVRFINGWVEGTAATSFAAGPVTPSSVPEGAVAWLLPVTLTGLIPVAYRRRPRPARQE